MCLIIFSFKQNKRYPLFIAANRDEFYKRATTSLDIWTDKKHILAGKDLESGGTWMGINRFNHNFAAITNYRDPSKMKTDAKSRGIIVTSFLESDISTNEFIDELKKEKHDYNGFNLLFGNSSNLYHYSNISNELTRIKPGIHAVSNALMNTPWPKVVKGKKELEKTLLHKNPKKNAFKLLMDNSYFGDEKLPNTGMGIEWERILSPLFIKSDVYGTRSSSVLIYDGDNNVEFIEKAFLDDHTTKETGFKLSKTS